MSVPNQWIGSCGAPVMTFHNRPGIAASAGGGSLISKVGRFGS